MTAARVLLALAIILSPLPARAQEVEAPTRSEPRPVPEYGRAPAPAEPAEALLWIPRIVFLPVHLVLEYLVRLPLGWLLRTIELERLDSIFRRDAMPQLAFQEEPPAWSFVPRFHFDFRLLPSVGLTFRIHDSEERVHLRTGFSFWGDEQVAGDLRLSGRFGQASLVLLARGGYRTDGIFQGLGWKSARSPRARYAEARGGGGIFVTGRPWRRTAISSGLHVDARRFGDSGFRQSDDLSIEEAIANGFLEAPPGYPEGYTALEAWVRVVLDTRDDGGWPHASGVRAELFGAWAIDVERGIDANWARAHADVELAVELMRDRTLSLRSFVGIAEELGARPVPFTEQVWLGTELSRMPGFVPGWLIGESAATVGLAWRYAIWAWLDAALFADVGNVFGSHFSDFDFERLRLSFGTALMAHDTGDFTLLVAFGTEPFVQGADVTSFRFAISIGEPVRPGALPVR